MKTYTQGGIMEHVEWHELDDDDDGQPGWIAMVMAVVIVFYTLVCGTLYYLATRIRELGG